MTTRFPQEMLDRLADARIVAGFSVDDPLDAAPIAEALLSGGIEAVELTLRTESAVEAVRAIALTVPEMLLGVGTILSAEDAEAVAGAGAQFGVSPGFNPRVVAAATKVGLPFAPGVATPSELESALELDCRFCKLFPAEQLGGVGYIRSLAGPYGHLGVRFLPLGGLSSQNMASYLAEPTVAAIGGSWLVPKQLVGSQDWSGIAALANEASYALKQLNAASVELDDTVGDPGIGPVAVGGEQ